MRYDKSLKLLNFAMRSQIGLTVAGNLQLFTELDHSFVVGDRVYIVGGYYDNCNNNLYSTRDPFADFTTGYKIIAVYSSNSFVIDYPDLYNFIVPVIFPYGTLLNPYGDPFDNTNKAYNCYTTTMEKGVYISTCAFTTGIMKKGTINNGIFGNDYHKVKLNNTGAVSGPVSNTDLIINHIVGKNIEISKGQFNSKTDASNLASSKLKVVEDATIVVNTIPFAIAAVSVTNNNNGYGYNIIERITNTATDIIINNGTFANPNNSFIALNNISINKAKIGNTTFIQSLANQMDKVVMGTGNLGSVNTLNDKIIVNGATVNTFIPLTLEIGNLTPVTYSAALKQIDIEVEYDVLANHYTAIGSTVYISGILGSNNYDLSHVTGTIAAMSYTFGTINSAVISIVFDIDGVVTGGDWTTWKGLNPVTDYDFTNIKIHLLQNVFEAGIFTGATFSSYFDSSLNFTSADLIIKDCTSIESYIKGATLQGSNVFEGVNNARNTYLTACAQIEQDTALSTTFSYTRIYQNITPLKGDFNYAYIQQGIIHNSNLFDTMCIPKNSGVDVIFLYIVSLSGMMYLDDEVYWDYMDASNITQSQLVGLTYIPGAYLGNGRTSAWVTGPKSGGFNQFKENPNKTKSLPHDSAAGVIYHTQSIATSVYSATLGAYTNVTKKIHVPSSENIQNPFTTSDIIVIVDKGSLSLTASNWSNTQNREDILYVDYTGVGSDTEVAIANRNSATTLPGNDSDFPLVNNGGGYRNLNTIDSNYIVSYNYFKAPHIREASDIALNIYEPAPLIAPYDNEFPDPATSACLTTRCRITGPGNFTCDNGATRTISNGTYNNLYLNVVGTVDNNIASPASSVPESFIEIESVRINEYTSGFGAILRGNLYYPNYTYNDYDRINATISASTFTDLNIQLYEGYQMPNPLMMTKSPGRDMEIIIEYWVTWYFYNTGYITTADSSTNGYSGGARTKRTQTFRFN